MSEQLAPPPQEMTPAQVAQEYGRHSEEHTAAQIGHIADMLIERTPKAMNVVNEEVKRSSYYNDGVKLKRNQLTSIEDKQSRGSERTQITHRIEVTGPKNQTAINKETYTDPNKKDVVHYDVITSSNSNPEDDSSSVHSHSGKVDGHIRNKGKHRTMRSIAVKRKASGRSFGSARAKIARQEIEDEEAQVEALDELFSREKQS